VTVVASPGTAPTPLTVAGTKTRSLAVATLLAMVGPGLMVMLADSDAGSVITAAQAGARFRYAFVLPYLLLVPVLYLVQEVTVRLGLATGQGLGALIRRTFGAQWALLSAGALFVACVGALVTEFAGVAGVGSLVGMPRWASTGAAAGALIVLVLLGRYRRVEHIGIAIGALELLFVPAALLAHPHLGAFLHDLGDPVHATSGYATLLAANLGAVIMPWMVFYQQGAVVDKGRRGLDLRAALRSARLDTAAGSVITQLVMIAVIVATGATLGVAHRGIALNSVGAIASALTPFLGHERAIVLFGLGMVGAALVAALVVMLAGAWGIAEVLGWRHSLNDSPGRAVGFYSLAVVGVVVGVVLVLVVPNLVNLTIHVEVLNACLLPIILGFLIALEHRALPSELRSRGARRIATYALAGVVIAFGLVTAATVLYHIV